MYSVGGDVLSVFIRTIFQSVFLVAYEITFTHLNIHHPFLPCACAHVSFFAASMIPELCPCLQCNLRRTASKRRVKTPCQSLIHWLTCNLFCLAALRCECPYMCLHIYTFMYSTTFDHSYPNHIEFFLFYFMKRFLLFGTVSRHPDVLFSMWKTDSNAVCPGLWPLRWLTIALVSRCGPPQTLPCPSTPNLMISDGHQANHSITHTAVEFPSSPLPQLAKKYQDCGNVIVVLGLFVCLFLKWLRVIGGNGSILVVVFLSFLLSLGLLLLVYLTNAGPISE